MDEISQDGFEFESSLDAPQDSSPVQPSGQQPASVGNGDSATPVTPVTETPASSETPVQQTEQPSAAEKRIHQLTAKNRQMEAQLSEERAQAAYYRGLAERPAPANATPQHTTVQSAPSPPNPADYDDQSLYDQAWSKYQMEWAEYVEERAVQRLKAETHQAEQTRKTQTETEKRQTTAQDFQMKINAEADRDPDFHDLIFDPSLTFLNGNLLQLVQESDQPIELLRHLALNPQDGNRLAGMDPFGIARELGKIEAKLTAPPPTQKRISSAPEPINTVGGHGAAIVTDDPLTSGSDDDYFSREAAKFA